MAQKFLDSEGVKTLVTEIYNTFAEKSEIKDYDEDVSALDGRIADVESGATQLSNELAGVGDRIDAVDAKVVTADAISALIAKALVDAQKGTKYEAAELKSAMSKTGIVKLAEDVNMGTQQIVVPADADIVLDLNGKEISSSLNGSFLVVNGGSLTIENGTIVGKKKTLDINNGATLVINNAVIESQTNQGITAGNNSVVEFNSGEVKSVEAGIAAFTGTKVIMNGGKITTTDNGGIMANGSSGQGDVEIIMNGGEIDASISSSGYVAVGVYMPNTGSFTMNGGKITANGGAGVVCRGGLTTINGGEIVTTAHPTLTVGKVGDSRVVVPCAAIVYDKNSKYPGMDSLEVVVNEGAVLNSAVDDIAILSDEENPKVTDNRVVEELPEE